MNYFLSVVAGIISGLIASGVWFIIVKTVKPKVEISDCICKKKWKKRKCIYQIKMINLSKVMITEVRVSFQFFAKQQNGNFVACELKPIDDSFNTIDRYRKEDKMGDGFAIIMQYSIDEHRFNIDNANQNKFVFEFSARHGLSGTVIYKKVEYNNVNQIKEGSFKQGKNLGI